jgi:hypothetical protein
MTLTDKEAYESEDLPWNYVEVGRSGYVVDAIRISYCSLSKTLERK